MPITLHQRTDEAADQFAALGVLNQSIWPPKESAAWPGRKYEWTPRQASVIVWNDDRSQALAHAGIMLRAGHWNERPVRIGGIGGVQTHPGHRHQGHARAAIARCVEFFREQGDIDIGLLVCVPELVPFYERLGWQPFLGTLRVMQFGNACDFTFLLPLTYPLRETSKLTGVIDLLGPPW